MTSETPILELSVLWQYDGPGGYVWRANFGGHRDTGRADTDAEAFQRGLAWLAERSGQPKLNWTRSRRLG